MASFCVHNSISQIPPEESDQLPEAMFSPPAWYLEHSLWIQDPRSPGNAAHNYPLAMRVRGRLDPETLARSLQEILRRHDVLRSVFRTVNGKPAQLIMPLDPLNVPVLDLTGLPEEAREAEAREAVFEDARRPFDLARGPMLRIALMRIETEDHILLLTTHHVVCDYWSTRILMSELFALYAAFSAKQPSPLPEPDFRYTDYVRWLETRLQTNEHALMGFWRERLDGKDFHHIAPDHVPPVSRSYRGNSERTIFPAELIDSIRQLSARERLSPFMILLAGLQCLVQQYSGDHDIGIGSCVANRPLPQLEGLVAPFANVSVLRTDLSGDPTGREVFRRVREVCLATFDHQDVPFGTLVNNFHAAFDPARHPIFQILFVLLNAPSEPWQAPGLTVDPIAVDTGASCFELNMNVRIDKRFEVEVQYSSDLFEPTTIRDILQDYRTVLESLCANADVRLAELAIKKKEMGIKEGQPDIVGRKYAAPKNRIESQLVELWESVLEKRPIGVNDNFFELGGDSLRAARLFARIEQTFKRSVPLGTLFQSPTIGALAKVISETGLGGNSCVVTIQPGDGSLPLFCIPGQTGSVLMFRNLARHLGSGQPVYGLQPQGLDGKQPPLTRIEDMAANFIKQVQVVQPMGPYMLIGYCMGGTIALEMAQQLHKQGEAIGLLAVLDTYNWGLLQRASFIDDFYFRVQQWWFSWKPGGLRWKELHRPKGLDTVLAVALPDRKKSFRKFSDFWAKPAAALVSDCNRDAAFSYLAQPYPGRLLHVRPKEQFARYKRAEVSLNRLAGQGVEEFFLPGYPAQMLEEPAVRDLAAKLRTCMDARVSVPRSDTVPPPDNITA